MGPVEKDDENSWQKAILFHLTKKRA